MQRVCSNVSQSKAKEATKPRRQQSLDKNTIKEETCHFQETSNKIPKYSCFNKSNASSIMYRDYFDNSRQS